MNGALINHSQDPVTVWTIVTSSLNNKNDVNVAEVTDGTLKSVHYSYASLIKSYFLPYNDYPAIQQFR